MSSIDENNQKFLSENDNFMSKAQSQKPYSKQTTSQIDPKHQQDEVDRQTFVTGLIDEMKDPHEAAQDQLNKYVGGIDDQFQNVLNRHENDFINAYRSHMVKVQKELVYLKNKASEAAGKILNDDTVTNLQKQIGWFKNEAIKLDQILETQKREVQKHKSRELNLVEDRRFLKGQIKDAMKHNKLLEVAVKKTNETNIALREFLRQNQLQDRKLLNLRTNRSINQQKGQISPTSIINQTMAQFNEPFITQKNQDQINIQIDNRLANKNSIPLEMLSLDSQDFKVKDFVLDLYQRGYKKDKIESKVAKFFKIYDQSRDNKIETLQKKVDVLRKANSKTKNSKANGFSEKSEIENLFLDCVDESKKDVLKKKAIANPQAKFSNNIIQENTTQEGQAIIDQVVLNKEALIGVFEEMFGSGGYVGTVIQNIEHQIKNKKYSLVSQGMDHTNMNNNNSISYFSNATTKDYQSEEIERLHMIMNAPIENLLSNPDTFSKSQSKIALRKRSANETASYYGKRASTAISGNHYLHNQTAISYYNDQSILNGINDESMNNNHYNNISNHTRPYTSHSQNRNGNYIIGQNDQKSRQPQINSHNKQNSTKEKSFSVRNGKLVIINTSNSQNGNNK